MVSARCVCGQLNFHNFITHVDMFSMLRSRVEVPLKIGPHKGARIGVPMYLNVLNFTFCASSALGCQVVMLTNGSMLAGTAAEVEVQSSSGADQHKGRRAQHDVVAERVPNAVTLRSLVGVMCKNI